MLYTPTLTTEAREAALVARNREAADAANVFAEAAREYADALGRIADKPVPHGSYHDYLLLQIHNTSVHVVDNGDFAEAAAIIMFENQWDANGDPVDEFGRPYASWNPSRVHPDDPCQSKGVA